MSLQTRELWMLALGLLGDAPPNALQPALQDGMHLRWAFDPARGFPWFGYYLFRRDASEKRERICLGRYWSRREPTTLGSTNVDVGFGSLASDAPLVLTEVFPPPGRSEVDLDHRRYVRYETPRNEPIRWAEATIGFRKGDAEGTRECVDFLRAQATSIPNPLRRGRARLTAHDRSGRAHPRGRVTTLGGVTGWDAGHDAEIKLPCHARQVEVTVANFTRGTPPVIHAVGDDGVIDKVVAQGSGVQIVSLTGQGIGAVRIKSPQNETIVVRICWICEDDHGGRERIVIRVTARWEGATVATRDVAGAPGATERVAISADAIDELEFSSGEAALAIDTCSLPASGPAGLGRSDAIRRPQGGRGGGAVVPG